MLGYYRPRFEEGERLATGKISNHLVMSKWAMANAIAHSNKVKAIKMQLVPYR